MARGKQTFNKSEREKKKRKHRLDKQERREDRKSNNDKGKTLEEMFAYVDEYGRLSSTPPDPTRKVSINVDDIQVSISRQPDVELKDGERSGIVSFFNESKGYGFIKDVDTKESFFVHISEVAQLPREGDKVTFKAEQRDRGMTAVEVKPAP